VVRILHDREKSLIDGGVDVVARIAEIVLDLTQTLLGQRSQFAIDPQRCVTQLGV
jgi:hypothetical protein